MLYKLKKIFWKLFEPIFPTVRDTWVFLGFMKHDERQRYLLGYLKTGLSRSDLRAILIKAGFEDDYLGWVDPSEILNMRKIINFVYQYHVRLFPDGEIRGHYEFSTESHPFKHLYEVGMTDGFDYLKPLLVEVMTSDPRSSPAKSNPKSHQRHS